MGMCSTGRGFLLVESAMSDSIKPLTATDTSKTFRIATPEITVDLELKKIDRQVVDSHSYEMPGLPADAKIYNGSSLEDALLSAYRDKALN
jgi:hypothetical protein